MRFSTLCYLGERYGACQLGSEVRGAHSIPTPPSAGARVESLGHWSTFDVDTSPGPSVMKRPV